MAATNVFVRPFSKLHYCCSFHDACRSELEAIDVSVGETFDDMARSCHGAEVTAPSVPPGCSYAAFFPIMLDCSDESNANDDDPHTHGPPFCESECRERLQQFQEDCGTSVPHDSSQLSERYHSLIGRLSTCAGLTPQDSGLRTENCILVDHHSDDNYDGNMHATGQYYNQAPIYQTLTDPHNQ